MLCRPLLNSLVQAPALESILCYSCNSGDKPRTMWWLSKSSASELHSSLTESFLRHMDIWSVCSADQWLAPLNETMKAGITTIVWYNGSVLSSNFWMKGTTWAYSQKGNTQKLCWATCFTQNYKQTAGSTDGIDCASLKFLCWGTKFLIWWHLETDPSQKL